MTNKMPAWDLSDYYTSMKDAKIAEDLESYRQGTEEFAKRYKGKLAELSAEEFLAAAKNIAFERNTFHFHKGIYEIVCLVPVCYSGYS